MLLALSKNSLMKRVTTHPSNSVEGRPTLVPLDASGPSHQGDGRQERAKQVIHTLREVYPDAHCELNHQGPFQLLIATILSAQCTDKRVNKVTPLLFKKYPTPHKLSQAKQLHVEEIIKSTGFFRSKAKNIISCSRYLVERYGAEIPQSMEELTSLPGVGRKTANVVLGNAFNINEGVVVDTHVKRISQLLKLTYHKDPVKIEQDLMKLFRAKEWGDLSHLMIFHGRRRCIARRPQCDLCELATICPSRK